MVKAQIFKAFLYTNFHVYLEYLQHSQDFIFGDGTGKMQGQYCQVRIRAQNELICEF